jgi:hypothetical protein
MAVRFCGCALPQVVSRWSVTTFTRARFVLDKVALGQVKCKGKVRLGIVHEGPEGEQRYIYALSLTSSLDGGWLMTRSGRSSPGKESRYPLCRRLDGLQGLFGRVRTISPTTDIRSPNRRARSQSLYRLNYTGTGSSLITSVLSCQHYSASAVYLPPSTRCSYQKHEGSKPGNFPKSSALWESGERWIENNVRCFCSAFSRGC